MGRAAASLELLCVATLLLVSGLAIAPERARAGEHGLPVAASIVAQVPAGRWVTLYSKPGGAPIVDLGDRTEFGSAMTFAVVGRRGSWLAVVSSRLDNHRIGWISDRTVRIRQVPVLVTVDLSARSLVVHRGARVTRRLTVAVGGPASPTPTGVFAVTDKLPGQRYASYYGCCILALSGHQPNLPPGWHGGDRIAIHGTNAPGSIGEAVSGGCLRAADGDLRVLMRTLPLGTKVTIRP